MSERRYNRLTVRFCFEACDNTKALLFRSQALLDVVIRTGYRLTKLLNFVHNLFKKNLIIFYYADNIDPLFSYLKIADC